MKYAFRTSANVNFLLTFTCAGLTIYTSSTFGQGTGPIFFTNIGCSGTESRLLQCSRSVFGVTSCTHSRDVGVKCEGNEQQSAELAQASSTICYQYLLLLTTV